MEIMKTSDGRTYWIRDFYNSGLYLKDMTSDDVLVMEATHVENLEEKREIHIGRCF
jgi:hypothetical protein